MALRVRLLLKNLFKRKEKSFHIWKYSKHDCSILIPNDCMNKLLSWSKKHAPHEVGGTLIGHYTENLSNAFVKHVIISKLEKKLHTNKFVRPSDDDDNQLERIYIRSKGRTHYLGEWHSHPSGAPTPSNKDTSTMASIAKSNNVGTNTPVMMIVGNDATSVSDCSLTIFYANGDIGFGVYEGCLQVDQ